MRKLVFVILVSCLLLTLLFLGKENIPPIEASPDIYQGDLVLTGNNVTVIEGRFDINGSIIIEENATLILRNAVINFTQTYNYQHNMTFQNPSIGNPRLIVENTTITSIHNFRVYFYGNSSIRADKLELWYPTEGYMVFMYDSSVASISNSTIYSLHAEDSSVVEVFNSTMRYTNVFDYASLNLSLSNTNELKCYDVSNVNVLNSTITFRCTIHSYMVNGSILGLTPGFFNFWNFSLDCSVVTTIDSQVPEVILKNTQVDKWAFSFGGTSNITIFNSTIFNLIATQSCVANVSNCQMYSVVAYHDTIFRLVNSTYTDDVYIHDQSKVISYSYLDVIVIDSIDQTVPSANVTVTFPNATLAEAKLTDMDGCARFTLLEKMMNATGAYPVGNYTVEATYDTHSDQTTVNMTENQQITLTLGDFIIPEFSTIIILPLFTITLLIIVIISKRKHPK